MKLTIFILVISLLQVTAATFGQNVTLKQSNVSIAKLFYEIRKQTGYDVLIKGTKLATGQLIDANFSNAPLAKVLDRIVAGTNLVYVITQKTVVIKEKDPSIPGSRPSAADINIRGRILDEKGQPLEGATVSLKGSTLAIKTGASGEFSFVNLPDDAVLIIRYVGYMTIEVPVKGAAVPLDINLKMGTSELDGVQVISTGYQTLSKERAVGSYGTLGTKELSKVTTFDLATSLEGRIAGVVRSSANGVTVRGTSTFLQNGQGQPLYVIDGYPVEGDLRTVSNRTVVAGTPFINPDNIESITVLKDAAAASIYGARAGNGVIIITTKKAKKGNAQISASSDVQVSPGADYDYMRYMPANKFLDLQWKYLDNNPRLQNPATRMNTVNSLRNNALFLSPSLNLMLKFYDGSLSRAETEKQISSTYGSDGLPLIDDLDQYINQPAITQRHFLSLGKATDGSNTMANITYTNQRGSVKNNANQFLDINLRNTMDLTKWLDLDFTAYLRYGNGKGNSIQPGEVASHLYPYSRLVDDQGGPLRYFRREVSSFYLPILEQYPNDLKPLDYSPIDELDQNMRRSKTFESRTAATLNAKITRWLKFSTGFQYERRLDESNQLYDRDSYVMRRLYNDFTAEDPISGQIVHRIPFGDSKALSSNFIDSYTWRNQMNFNLTSKDGKHAINALAGMEVRQISGRAASERIFGYDQELLTWAVLDNKNLLEEEASLLGSYASLSPSDFHTENESKNRYLSYYGNAGYTFMNRYDVTGSIRWDKSNFFGTNPKYQNRPLWSAGLGWHLEQEEFLKGIKWIDRLRLRATYGINGNIARDVSPYLIAKYGEINQLTGRPYGSIGSPPNANLRWEKVKVSNLGLDFNLLDQRISGAVEYYYRNSTDLLIDTEIDPTFGFDQLKLNVGNMTNKGWEFTLNGLLLQKKDLMWSAGMTFAYNKNTVTRSFIKPVFLSNIVASGTSSDLIQGYPLNSLFSYRFARINEHGDPVIFDEKGAEVSDVDMDNLDGLAYSGSLIPLYSGGINTTVNWKGLELAANFVYNAGHKMRKLTAQPHLTGPRGPENLMYNGYDMVWQKAGDELIEGMMPRITYAYDENTGYRNTYWQYGDDKVISASNIRLRTLTLSYNVPKKVLNKPWFNSLRVRAQVNDLFYLAANKQDIDPEAYSLTGGSLSRRQKPTYSFGLNLSF